MSSSISSADILSRLTTGLEHDITVEQNLELARVARGELSLDEFLTRFGHRTTNEMELSQSRWSEDSSLLERMLAGFRSAGTSAATSPAERHARQVAARLAAEAALPGQLAESGASSFRERVQSLVAETQRLLPYRELGKYHLMRGYATLRAVLKELGERWDLGADVFFLRLDELSTFEASTHSARVAERKLRWKSAQKLMLADVIDSRRLEELGQQPAAVLNPDSQQLEARPIAAGVATGVARIVTNPDEIGDLGSDYILVCPSTDPGWTPLFVQARGLIVERGGVLSHGAIVARDFGIPAVVCPQATRLIAEGAMLQIDGNRGVIVVSRQD